MRIELLTIGTELLLGFTLDTNSAEIGRALAAAGIAVVRRTSVGDDPGVIRDAVAEALGRTGAVLCTGGLGPTADDVTKKVVADLYGMPLEFHPELWDGLLARFARFGRVPSEKNRSQAEVPRGASVLPNRWGTAPGLWLESGPGLTILLPGVPTEMRGLLQHEVLPRLAGRAGGQVVRSQSVRTTGIPESSLAERLGDVESVVAPLSLAYLPGVLGVDLRLTAWNRPPAEAEERLAAGVAELELRAGEWVYGTGEDDLAALVLAQARARGWTLATAESCTGGGIGVRLTDIPGSSDTYVGGVIAYDNRLKQTELGVPAALLEEHGAVSEPVARALALGAMARLRADLSIAVTGIAGPGGGTPEKPVGLVYVAAGVQGVVEARRLLFPGSRGEVRARAAQAGLFLLFRRLGGRGGA
jgi:competence/damage-inducible protein CinA-like protein